MHSKGGYPLTGIFPIGRYDTQSALNNFDDINMLTPEYDLTRYFVFTEGDVQKLCAENNLSFDDAKSWYDGYHMAILRSTIRTQLQDLFKERLLNPIGYRQAPLTQF